MNPRISGSVLLLLAVLGCFASMSLAFGRPGDSSIRDQCERSAWSTYRTAQETPAVDGPLCTADARKRVHVALGLLPVSILLGAVGSLRFSATPRPRTQKPSPAGPPRIPRRATPRVALDPDPGPEPDPEPEPSAPADWGTPEPHSNVRTIPPAG